MLLLLMVVAILQAVFSTDEITVQLIFDLQEVKLYIQQSILEKELLYFGYEAFGITFVDPVSEEIIGYPAHVVYLDAVDSCRLISDLCLYCPFVFRTHGRLKM